MQCLTVKLVENIQEAAERDWPVSSIVSQLESATLPGLLEYGCLRWATQNQLPPLPQSIRESPLGRALSQVRCELGLRSSGPQKQRLMRLDVQSAEFHVIEDANGIDEELQQFEIRFDRSAQNAEFSKTNAHALQAALHEMAENAVIHAEAPGGILVGYQVVDGCALFSVVDVGIGVLASLRTNPTYSHIRLHKDAIRAALHDGTTRFGQNTRGLGFRQVFKALAAQWGYLRFRSGTGCVTLNGQALDADQGEESFPPYLPGFQVTVCCRSSPCSPSDPWI